MKIQEERLLVAKVKAQLSRHALNARSGILLGGGMNAELAPILMIESVEKHP